MEHKTVKTICIGLVLLWSAGLSYAGEPEQKFHGFNLQGYTKGGVMAWNVNGDTANIVGSEIILSNVDADTYGEQKMNVTAKIGIVDQVSGKMHLEEDVVITSADGMQLLTDSLDWDRKEDLVTTEDDVVIISDRMTASGTGMKAQPGLGKTEIKKDVTVIIETNSQAKADGAQSETVTITSDGPMIIDQALSVATFEDNVVAIQGDQTLKSDRMEIYFDETMSGIKKMICLGNVEIVQGGNRSFANKAIYNAIDQKLTLSGRPKLILMTEGGGLFAASGD